MRLHVLAGDEWAARVAGELAARLRANPQLRLCLATGDTPAPAYRLLAEAEARGEVSLRDATVLLLDEYADLPADDPARGDSQLRRDLLGRLEEAPSRYFPIRVDDLLPEEAAAVHDEVAARGIDLAVVGIGANGHVGFNEPGSTAESGTRAVELQDRTAAAAVDRYGARHAPRRGVTLGLARLLEASEIWLLATGRHKAAVLRAALDGPESSDCPASYLRRHARVQVFADDAAAELE